MLPSRITAPQSAELAQLSSYLRSCSDSADEHQWPAEQLRICGQCGVFEWFATRASGGQEWTEADLMRGYLALTSGCLTTAFVITQRTAACQRIERSDNQELKRKLLPDLLSGQSFATVGISHLTTSRRHLATPVLQAEEVGGGFRLNGYAPWVTGANHAQHLVVGASLADQRQMLLVVPTEMPGVRIPLPESLVGLTGSHTGRVEFENTWLDRQWLLAGPHPEIMKQGVGARTGGLQTSTLALGLARTAIDYLLQERGTRDWLATPADALLAEWDEVHGQLFASLEGAPTCTDTELRTRANSLVLRATQAAMTAAKGAGYVTGHPVGRWCREALFFLVWSCPPVVLSANLCEFAGIEY